MEIGKNSELCFDGEISRGNVDRVDRILKELDIGVRRVDMDEGVVDYVVSLADDDCLVVNPSDRVVYDVRGTGNFGTRIGFNSQEDDRASMDILSVGSSPIMRFYFEPPIQSAE